MASHDDEDDPSAPPLPPLRMKSEEVVRGLQKALRPDWLPEGLQELAGELLAHYGEPLTFDFEDIALLRAAAERIVELEKQLAGRAAG